MSTNPKIIVKPEEIWDYFDKRRAGLIKTMQPVAINEEYDVTIYLTNNSGLPSLVVESENIESVEFIITDKESCVATVQEVYDLYLTEQFLTVVMEEAESDDEELSESDIAEEISQREDDLTGCVLRFIEDALDEDNQILYTDLIDDIVEDCKEHFLEYLYRKHGVSTYRPMELEDEDGVFIEDYPYEYMEFEPSPLYDDFKVTDLAINGKDVVAIGIPQGKEVGETLELFRKFVVGGIFPNDRDTLLKRLITIKK